MCEWTRAKNHGKYVLRLEPLRVACLQRVGGEVVENEPDRLVPPVHNLVSHVCTNASPVLFPTDGYPVMTGQQRFASWVGHAELCRHRARLYVLQIVQALVRVRKIHRAYYATAFSEAKKIVLFSDMYHWEL